MQSPRSPVTARFIRARRDTREEPGEEVADFEEYTRLYRESWSDPDIRWLLSTVPSVMIFDDHDVNDDWNISWSWIEEMRRQPWWDDRITGAFMSYWIYQHIGNLSPPELAAEELLRLVELPLQMTLVKRPSLERQRTILGVEPEVSLEDGVRRVCETMRRRLAAAVTAPR